MAEKKIAEGKKPIDQMTKAELIEQIKQMAGKHQATSVSGWLVETKRKDYNEKTYNVQFRNGRALVMDKGAGENGVNENEEKVKLMNRDFGYKVTYYEDLNQVPEFETSLVDVLQKD